MKVSHIFCRHFTAILASVLLLCSCANDRQIVKTVVFPTGATAADKIEIASRVVPSPQQQRWQDLELTAFLHFGPNTFTGREWGDGQEAENIFNPSDLDTDQWVKTLKDAGFRLVILTAKHHDGFCLWPTATTSHSVASSSWREGRGDVMRDLQESCRRHGMKFGVYLSPWDMNAPTYGDSPCYNDYFVAQLTELLTNYGTIDEVWFDGACGEGPNGRKQEYDWQRYIETVHRLQPDAVVAVTGDDVRWVGNEGGIGRETEWSVTPLVPGIFTDAAKTNERLGINSMSPQLGSREVIAAADSIRWWPSEVDVSIRPGWFYHPEEQPKTLEQLKDIYLKSVGRNSVLLLNIPPDTDGRINAADSSRLMELREWIVNSFDKGRVPASSGRHNLSLRLRQPTPVNAVQICEDISKGQRVESFSIIGKTQQGWKELTRGTTVGRKRILVFPETEVSEVRLIIGSSRGPISIKSLNLFRIQ